MAFSAYFCNKLPKYYKSLPDDGGARPWSTPSIPKESPKGEEQDCFFKETQFLSSGPQAKGYSTPVLGLFHGPLWGCPRILERYSEGTFSQATR